MRRTVCLILVVFAAGGLCVALLGIHLKPDPSTEDAVRFDRKTIDIGEVIAGLQSEVVFHFTNDGPTSAKIVGVKATCSCKGDIQYPKTDVAPGEGADITLELTPTVGREHILFMAMVSKDDKLTTIPLEVLCRPFQDAVLEPSTLIFTPVSVGKTASGEARVFASPRSFSRESISCVAPSSRWIRVAIEEATDPPQKETVMKSESEQRVPVARIVVSVNPGAPLGAFSETLTFEIKDSNGSRNVFLTCKGEVCESVRAVPPRLVLLPIENADLAQISIKSIDGPLVIQTIKSDIVECSLVQPSEGNDEARIRVSLPKQVKKTDGSIWVEIDHPSVQNVVVPVKIVGIDADLPGSQDERPGGLR